MVDRDKLLHGLECCNHTGRELYRGGCSRCPYHEPDNPVDCRTRRDLDTMELLMELGNEEDDGK